MSYTQVPIQTKLNQFSDQIKEADKKGEYKGQGQHWDDLIAKVLTEQCATAEKNVRLNWEFIERQRESAKQRMNELEQLLKSKNLSESDHKMIQETPAFMQQCVFRISGDLQDLLNANLEYRGGWPAKSKELLSSARQGICGTLRKLSHAANRWTSRRGGQEETLRGVHSACCRTC